MTAATRSRKTDEERKAEVEALTEQLHTAVGELTSSEAWMRMLAVAAKFHRYSWRNQILLAIQAEDRGVELTRVAGFNRWKELARIVRRGERGFQVLAPVLRRLTAEEVAKWFAEGKNPIGPDDKPRRVVRGFRIEHVFDQAQTDLLPGAEDLPERPSWIAQRGSGPAGLWEAMAELVERDGFELQRNAAKGGAHGWTDYTSRVVSVRPDVDEAEAIRILIHESGHIRADHENRKVSKPQRETEADSIAYIVATAAGLDISGSAVEYVAGCSDGDEAVLTAAVEAISKAAASILAQLEVEA